MIKQLSIVGLRGFGKEQLINFAVPNNNAGSGITFLVGANNSGKTTIIEALRSFNCDPNSPPNFSERKRNKKCEGGKVHLKVMLDNNDAWGIRLSEMLFSVIAARVRSWKTVESASQNRRGR